LLFGLNVDMGYIDFRNKAYIKSSDTIYLHTSITKKQFNANTHEVEKHEEFEYAKSVRI
jgi:hypothetical protein